MSRRRIDWSQWDPLLGTMSDAEVAERSGVSVRAVFCRRHVLGIRAHRQKFAPRCRRHEVDWDAQPFGQVSDHQLARALSIELGVRVSHVVVWAQRTKRGIPAARHFSERINWDAQPLGQVSDVRLADVLGVSPDTVGARRRERGIPAIDTKFRREG